MYKIKIRKVMQQTVRERLINFIKYKKLSQKKFEQIVGLSNGYVNNISRSLGAQKLAEISRCFPDLNQQWLLTGEGSMLRSEKPHVSANPADGIPYYKEMPVSAGRADLMDVESSENAIGSINISGVSGQYAFPVVGCSMEPVIHAGDIVVVDEMSQWEKLDPDKIYLIFTHDDRMIKHLECDENNNEILWCVSLNYKRFSLQKTEILRIYKVTFYGRLA